VKILVSLARILFVCMFMKNYMSTLGLYIKPVLSAVSPGDESDDV